MECPSFRRALTIVVLAGGIAQPWGPAGASGQGVGGRVVDYSTSRPVAGASIVADGTEIRAVTNVDGWFRIESGPAGRIIVSHLGYVSEIIEVQRAVDSLTVQLRPMPIAIQGIAVTALGGRSSYSVTRESVRQVPALAEPDLLRAVALLPLASQPNDLKGRIHLAGGSSDETGLVLDGHPLTDPFHMLGLLSAFPLATLDRADVFIHHMPPEYGTSLSGVVAMTTTPPGDEPLHEITAGLASTTAAYSRALPFGLDVLASGRVTYIDRLADIVNLNQSFPRYGFRDGLLRVGMSRDEWRTELLAFGTRDRFRDVRLEKLGRYDPLSWGESLVGVRVARETGRSSFSARAALNTGSTSLDERNVGSPNFIRIRRETISVGASAGIRSERVSARSGLAFDRRRTDNDWVAMGLADDILSPGVPGVFSGADALDAASAWGEAVWRPIGTVRVATGARASHVAGDWFVSPRIEVAVQARSGLAVRLSANRRFQFDGNVEEPVEGSASPPVVFLPNPRRADIVAASLEYPMRATDGTMLRLRGDIHLKSYTNRILLEPSANGSDSTSFPSFARTNGDAIVSAFGMRATFRESGMLEVSYSFQRVRESVNGTMFPTSWDVPHTVAGWGSWQFRPGWTVNGVVQARSGRATTPVELRVFAPRLEDIPGHLVPSRYIEGARNSVRVPSYQRVDVGIRRTWHGRQVEWTLAFQVLNLFARTNAIDYDWLQYYRGLASGGGDGLRSGLPILPTAGLEVRW